MALACICFALGLWLVVSAIMNWDWIRAVIEFAAVETVFGENATRWLAACSGIFLVASGIAVLVRMR